MKKLIYLLFILLLATTVLAEDKSFDLLIPKETYSQGETLQLHIKTNYDLFSSLNQRNIRFVDPLGAELSLAQGFIKVNTGEYYIYFDLPLQLPNGTYHVKVVDVAYKNPQGTTSLYNTEKTITLQKNPSALSVRPGAFFKSISSLEQPGFQITLSNHGTTDLNLGVSTDHPEFIKLGEVPSVLKVGMSTPLDVTTKVAGTESAYFSGNILIHADPEEYSIPLILIREGSTQALPSSSPAENTVPMPVQDLTHALRILLPLKSIEQTLTVSKTLEGTLPLQNTANSALHDITFSLSDHLSEVVTLDPPSVGKLNPGEVRSFTITLNKNKTLTKDYEGNLTITTSEGAKSILPILVHLQKAEISAPLPQTPLAVPPSIVEPTRSYAWLYVLLVVVILGLGVFIYFKKKNKENFPHRPTI